MAENYHYHHYAPSDLDEILALFSLSFNGLELSPEYYKWRVLDTPVNKNLVDLFKNDNGKIISHYAVCPVKSFYNGETSLSELSLITMTHPEYKSLGLFPKLAAKLYERSFNEENIQLVYGFPNTNSHYSFVKKLAWNDVYMIPTMKKLLQLLCREIKVILRFLMPTNDLTSFGNNTHRRQIVFMPMSETAHLLTGAFLIALIKSIGYLHLKTIILFKAIL